MNTKSDSIVMTLLCRNEVDIILANLDFHFLMGIDAAIVTDNASDDGTFELLQEYSKKQNIYLMSEKELTHDQSIWVTRMADIAVNSFGTSWLIHNDADEFWIPRCENFKEYFSGIDQSINVLNVSRSNMLPPSPIANTTGKPFYEAQLIKEATSFNSLGFKLPGKICHRAMKGVRISDGNHHLLINEAIVPPNAAQDIEIIHYPIRSLLQFENKIRNGSNALERNKRINKNIGNTWRELKKRLDQEGSLLPYLKSIYPTEEEISDGLLDGSLIREERILKWLTN